MAPVFTVGHGTRTTEELAALLREASVARLVDVRRFPGSRRHPHFAREALTGSLPSLGIEYEWRGEELGGRRSRKRDGTSRHPAWRNDAFGAYADYMDAPQFRGALERLEAAARAGTRLAVMCAETLWWRCHRRLIADALTVHGFEVVHLVGPGSTAVHPLNESARRGDDGFPVYDVGVTVELPLEPGRRK
ncbi:MAG TPA: DUF488 domain-containing protein [Actinomycetota bacterium]|nr:DUF488 domain-containing protein [Actinomycetota bacterium]